MTGFRYVTPVEVRFRDCDPIGHVNNAVFLTYIEVARFGYWRDVIGPPDAGLFGFVLARAECDFRAPAYPGNALDVGMRVDRIGRSSFVMVSRIERPADARVLFKATTVLVMFDHAANKSVPMPRAIREALSTFEGRELS